MHPLIARFISFPAAVECLEKGSIDAASDADESALLSAAAAYPASRANILKARAKSPSAEAQQELIVFLTRAATAQVFAHPTLGPLAHAAKSALEKEGATPKEADDLVAQAVLEEAFGYAEDPSTFDADYLAETLQSLSTLATVSQERVDEWLETFARDGAVGDRALRLKVAEVLLERAWNEGPAPITPEHLDDAIEHLGDQIAESEFAKATQTLTQFLNFLTRQQVLGPQRQSRLTHLLVSATAGGPENEEEEAEAED